MVTHEFHSMRYGTGAEDVGVIGEVDGYWKSRGRHHCTVLIFGHGDFAACAKVQLQEHMQLYSK